MEEGNLSAKEFSCLPQKTKTCHHQRTLQYLASQGLYFILEVSGTPPEKNPPRPSTQCSELERQPPRASWLQPRAPEGLTLPLSLPPPQGRRSTRSDLPLGPDVP